MYRYVLAVLGSHAFPMSLGKCMLAYFYCIALSISEWSIVTFCGIKLLYFNCWTVCCVFVVVRGRQSCHTGFDGEMRSNGVSKYIYIFMKFSFSVDQTDDTSTDVKPLGWYALKWTVDFLMNSSTSLKNLCIYISHQIQKVIKCIYCTVYIIRCRSIGPGNDLIRGNTFCNVS